MCLSKTKNNKNNGIYFYFILIVYKEGIHATQDLRKLNIVSKILYITNLEKFFRFLFFDSQFGETLRLWQVSEWN